MINGGEIVEMPKCVTFFHKLVLIRLLWSFDWMQSMHSWNALETEPIFNDTSMLLINKIIGKSAALSFYMLNTPIVAMN